MAKVTENKPKMLCLEFRQEKTDKDYGSCLWARFTFNLERYELSITSDCGNYAYKWCETPKSESFLELMARINEDYLLEKLYGQADVFDYESTKERIYEIYGTDEEEIEKLDAIFFEVEVYGSTPDNSSEFLRVFEDNNRNDFSDVWEFVKYDYPGDVIKICKVFAEYIQPYIRGKVNNPF